MKACRICSTLLLDVSEYCIYCGYKYDYYDEENMIEEPEFYRFSLENNYPTLNEISDASFLRRMTLNTMRFRDSPLYIVNKLNEKIEAENEKVNQIKVISKHIVNNMLKEKISSVIVKLEGLVNNLILKKIELDFYRFIECYNSIEEDIKTVDATEIYDFDSYLFELDNQFSTWKDIIVQEFHGDEIIGCIKEKEEEFGKLKEKIALIQLSKVLSNSSPIENTQTIKKMYVTDTVIDIENEIESINYEIDRLNGEIELS